MMGFLLSDPYKPLDIEFLKEQPQKLNTPKVQNNIPAPKNDNPKAFENIIKDYNKIEGFHFL